MQGSILKPLHSLQSGYLSNLMYQLKVPEIFFHFEIEMVGECR